MQRNRKQLNVVPGNYAVDGRMKFQIVAYLYGCHVMTQEIDVPA
jgi:hypothetical protein